MPPSFIRNIAACFIRLGPRLELSQKGVLIVLYGLLILCRVEICHDEFIEQSMTSLNWLAWNTPKAVRIINIQHAARLPLNHYEDLLDCEIRFNQE